MKCEKFWYYPQMSDLDQLIMRDTGLTVQDAAEHMGVARQTLAKRLADPTGDLGYRHWLDLASSLVRVSVDTKMEAQKRRYCESSLTALLRSLLEHRKFDLRADLGPVGVSMQVVRNQLADTTLGQALFEPGWRCTALLSADGATLWANPVIKDCLIAGEILGQPVRVLVLCDETDLLNATIPAPRRQSAQADNAVCLMQFAAARLMPPCLIQFDRSEPLSPSWRGIDLDSLEALSPGTLKPMVGFLTHVNEMTKAGMPVAYRGVDIKLLD
jgi:hypothetical protein